ncbi:hypothetical protein PT974_00827 [Cladobotryum mycophilum]|uniref:Uncharacterized protein n=1 Tax=Cladobotryum mycophilum TaxID=491253 RepID=A0ABR0T253_9HYPO
MQFSKILPLALAAVAAADPLATFWNYPNYVGDAALVYNDQQCMNRLSPGDIPTIVSIKLAPGVSCTTFTDKTCKNLGSQIDKDLDYIPAAYNYKSIHCRKN